MVNEIDWVQECRRRHQPTNWVTKKIFLKWRKRSVEPRLLFGCSRGIIAQRQTENGTYFAITKKKKWRKLQARVHDTRARALGSTACHASELKPTSKGSSIIFNYIEHWLWCDALSAQIYVHLVITLYRSGNESRAHALLHPAHTHQKYSTFNYSNMELKVTRPIALRTLSLNEFFSNVVCSYRTAAIFTAFVGRTVYCHFV